MIVFRCLVSWFVVRCLLAVVGCQLIVGRRKVFVACWLCIVVNCLLSAVCYVLFVCCCLLKFVRGSL